MIRLARVKGYSMSPSYLDGDYLLSVTSRLFTLQNGDVVIIKHPTYGYLVKEICRKVKKGYYVQGTHPASTDSR
jgi:phage repressor protein C with HTH and peptisase S24 domain